MSDWSKVYETNQSSTGLQAPTGRWQWLTVTDGYKSYYPGWWLPAGTMCPPPGCGDCITDKKPNGNNP